MTLDEIGVLVREYSDRREGLAEVVNEVRDLQRRAVRDRIRSIRSRVTHVSTARDALDQAINSNRLLFAKPRTQSLHGIKFGLRKMPGRIVCEEAEAIARIERKRPEDADKLVRTKKTLVRAALVTLPARELAALGISLVQDDDQVVIAAASNDIDKLVDAMLAEEDEA